MDSIPSRVQNAAVLGALGVVYGDIGTSPLYAFKEAVKALVNWLLALATLGAVVGFGSSDRLAGAYGIAVSLLMAITTGLATLIALKWGYNPILVARDLDPQGRQSWRGWHRRPDSCLGRSRGLPRDAARRASCGRSYWRCVALR